MPADSGEKLKCEALCMLRLGWFFFHPQPSAKPRQICHLRRARQIVEGTGGAKITKNGIDYWTTGTPPRKYQIIGYVQDKRDEEWDGGGAIGSRNIANKVKKAGGNAVIIQSQEEAGSTGSFGTGQIGGLFLGGGSKTITRMVVVKYLPE